MARALSRLKQTGWIERVQLASLPLFVVALLACNTLDEPGDGDTAFSPGIPGSFPLPPGGMPRLAGGSFGPPGGVSQAGASGFPAAAGGGSVSFPVAGSGGFAPPQPGEDAGSADEDAGR